MKLLTILTILGFFYISYSQYSFPIKSRSLQQSPYASNISNYLDFAYYIEISVGTPPQNFKVVLDTTSTDLWIPGKNCTDTGLGFCANHSKYDSANSSTFTPANSSSLFNGEGFPDGSGYLQGKAVGDKLSIAGLEVGIVEFVEFETTDITNNTFLVYDGILGLTYPSSGDYSIFQKIVDRQLLSNNSFSLYFGAEGSSDGGELTLGGYNPNINATPFEYIKFSNNDTFTFGLDKLAIGSKTYALELFTITLGAATPYIQVFSLLQDLILKDHPKFVSCDEVPNLPSIFLTIKKHVLEIPASNYYAKNGDLCEFLIQGNMIFPTEIVIGAPFFKSYYTQILYEDHMMGYAPIKNQTSGEEVIEY